MRARSVDQQVLAVGGQARVDARSAALDREAADQDEGAVPLDGVAGDGARAGVDGEEVRAVVADLDPAKKGRRLTEARRRRWRPRHAGQQAHGGCDVGHR
jgi:hypothetical protein